MTKFNPENKEVLSHVDVLSPVMKITDQEDANHYLQCICDYYEKRWKVEGNKTGLTAKEVALANIGYFAGYGDSGTFNRVMKLFSTHHPVFGTNYPDTDKAFSQY